MARRSCRPSSCSTSTASIARRDGAVAIDAVPPPWRAAADDHRRPGDDAARGPVGGSDHQGRSAPSKEALIAMCQKLPIRLGRIFALGSWGDAVIVARSFATSAAIALLAVGARSAGRHRRQAPPDAAVAEGIRGEARRVREAPRRADEQQILARLTGITFERRGDLVVVDVLEADGTWDQRKSMHARAAARRDGTRSR